MSENPWIKFYPRDWRGDQALRAVSVAARGLWIECLCIMHEAKPYGHLLLNGTPVEDAALARMTGVPVDEVSVLLTELRQAGVLSVTGKGVVFSRRMTKDHARAHKGRISVKKRWSQDAEIIEQKGSPNRSPNREPITQKPEARGQKEGSEPVGSSPSEKPPSAVKTKARRATRIVEGWTPNDVDRAFAKSLGAGDADIDRTAASFRDFWLAKGGKDAAKADWSATWRTWCRREAEAGKFSGRQTLFANGPPRPVAVVTDVDDATWRTRLSEFRSSDRWRPEWGPPFGQSGSAVPERLLIDPVRRMFDEMRKQECGRRTG